MTTITENVDLPTGVDPSRAVATLQLFQADGVPLLEAEDTTTGKTIAGRYNITLDGVDPNSPTPGSWELVDELVPNINLDRANSVWGRTLTGPGIDPTVTYGIVPTSGVKRWRQILADPPGALTSSALAAHASSTTLHGGGQELAFADIGANFVTASTTYVDIPGGSITFVVPARSYNVKIVLPFLMEEASRRADFRIVWGSTPSLLIQDSKYSTVALHAHLAELEARIPCRTQPTPVPGTMITYKAQCLTSQASSDISIFVDFGSPVNEAWMQAVTC